jgi:hypothetical protein
LLHLVGRASLRVRSRYVAGIDLYRKLIVGWVLISLVDPIELSGYEGLGRPSWKQGGIQVRKGFFGDHIRLGLATIENAARPKDHADADV